MKYRTITNRANDILNNLSCLGFKTITVRRETYRKASKSWFITAYWLINERRAKCSTVVERRIALREEGRKEGNDLFNDIRNTFSYGRYIASNIW